MVVAFAGGEAAQLAGTVALIKAKGLAGKLKAHDWPGVARGWNGAGYAANHYDTKLAAFAKWARIPDTPWSPGAVAAPAAVASSTPKASSSPPAAAAPVAPIPAAPTPPAPAAGGLFGGMLARLRAAYSVTPAKKV